jgi:hypothetical protein
MTARYLPTWRGPITLFFAVVWSMFVPAAIPRVATLGDWQCAGSVIVIRILGVLFAVVCVAGCIEAFRRGSRADKLLACAAAWFTYQLIYAVLRSFFYTIVP